MLITKTIAAAGLSLIVNGVPLQANFLQGNAPGCEMSGNTAKEWRSAGEVVVEQRVGAWCIAGKVAQGHWVAEQWRTGLTPGGRSSGWLVRIPLQGERKTQSSFSGAHRRFWPLDVYDVELKARFRFRQSPASFREHHQTSLASVPQDALVFTHPHPDGGSYSFVIEQGAKR